MMRVVFFLLFAALLVLSGAAEGYGFLMRKLQRRCCGDSKTLLWAAKGRGEKKKQSQTASIPPPAPSQAPARRVNQNTNISMRQQIAWAKAYKRLLNSSEKSGNSGAVKKKFKKERTPKEEEEEYVEIDYQNTPPPAVFVDGYNIIFYMNMVDKREISLEDARDCLISDLSILHAATGWYIEVVFDAYKAAGPQKRESIDNVFVTYTGASETADNFIERRFNELSNEGFTNMIVATDDNVLRMVAGTVGSGYLSADMLVEELRIAYRGWEMVEEELDLEVRRHRPKIGDALSSDMKNAIEELKRQNKESLVKVPSSARPAAAAAATANLTTATAVKVAAVTTAAAVSLPSAAKKKPQKLKATPFTLSAFPGIDTSNQNRRKDGASSVFDLDSESY